MKFAQGMTLGAVTAAACALAACEIHPRPVAKAPAATPSGPANEVAAAQAPPLLDIPPAAPSASPVAQPIDQAVYADAADKPESKRDMLIRAQVLLDRAHISPGVIDGKDGENVRNAVAAFERANRLPVDGQLDADVWAKLTDDMHPVLTDYVITPQDAAGPFVTLPPKDDYEAMAKLPKMGFTSPLEMLAERFHMDPALLTALNPGADFAAAGTKIVVAAVGPQTLPEKVATIEVDKGLKQVRAYDAAGLMLAAYPATVGSTDLPTPSGELAVRTIAPNPTWTYDPSKLSFGKPATGKLTIKAGPNNPVGAVWIDLTRDTYGIHGAPEPKLVGKTASHGCVRLTNWDARQLGAAVSKGTQVVFVGVETPKA